MLTTKTFSVALGALGAMFTPAFAELPTKVIKTAVVDGFVVNLRAFPHTARLRRPTSKTGQVKTGVSAPGTSPYADTKLEGNPFISVQTGTVTYTLKKPAASIAFIWGTPDPYNLLNIYDVSGTLVGTLNGGDIRAAFGRFIPAGFYQIVSPTPIGSVVGSSTGCCFEIANQGAMYAVPQ